MKFFYIIIFGLSIFISPTQNSFAEINGNNIIISEISYDPLGTEPGSEWIELYNPTEKNIDISGWTLTDGEGTLTFPASTFINSGDYYLLVHSSFDFNVNFPAVSVDLEYSPIDVGSIYLANSGDDVSLYDGLELVDFVSWEGSTVSWDIFADDGFSVTRNSSFDTDTENDWTSNQVSSPKTGSLSLILSIKKDSSKIRSSKKSRIRYGCHDVDATNYNRFSRQKNELCRYDDIHVDLHKRCSLSLKKDVFYGEKGSHVLLLQSCIQKIGFDVGPLDGIYGPLTFKAVIEYQKSLGIDILNGIIYAEKLLE